MSLENGYTDASETKQRPKYEDFKDWGAYEEACDEWENSGCSEPNEDGGFVERNNYGDRL